MYKVEQINRRKNGIPLLVQCTQLAMALASSSYKQHQQNEYHQYFPLGFHEKEIAVMICWYHGNVTEQGLQLRFCQYCLLPKQQSNPSSHWWASRSHNGRSSYKWTHKRISLAIKSVIRNANAKFE